MTWFTRRSIGVFCPCGAPDPVKTKEGMDWLRALGFEVQASPLLSRYLSGEMVPPACGYLAGSDQERMSDIRWALQSGFGLAWAARGGYGLTRLISPMLELFGQLDDKPTTLVGFSDVTALFEVARHFSGGPKLLHAPNVQSIPVQTVELDHLKVFLTGEVAAPIQLQLANAHSGPVQGQLIGGNLCVLASMCGWAPPDQMLADTVAFFEDVSEAPYRLDRYLTQLRLAGWFSTNHVQAVVLGEFEGCSTPTAVLDIFLDRLSDLEIPIYTGLPSGHARRNRPLLIGQQVELRDGQLLVGPSD
jgi:muramoyltetrapeptide carboxypeptidase